VTGRTLMVQGTTSDAGKSTLVAALCRVLHRRGISVAPFKPQNMALNSAVTADGGEIGRSQALQAQAAGIAPSVHMNPVLLKPNTDTGAQVIIHGRAVANLDAQAYHDYKRIARKAVLESHARLTRDYTAVIVEGAGSPAEINLRANDIANMGFAEAVDCPVILIADIDRGGVFAHLVGTLELLSASEQARVVGFVINRFRGDIALLKPGLDWLEQRTGKPVLGVLPWLHGLYLDAEDALPREAGRGGSLRVVVPALPRISNHTDFDPLRAHPQVDFRFIGPGETPPPADLVILPGSKSVRADLAHLRRDGWETYLQKHLRYGGRLIGICGGLQMLGTAVHDPLGLEGPAGSSAGFGWLDLDTTLDAEKTLRNVTGTLQLPGQPPVAGYEIHAGISQGPALCTPAVQLDHRSDGAHSADGQILASYLHGLFDQAEACRALLAWAGLTNPETVDAAALREASLERLADSVEEHLDLTRLLALTGAAEKVASAVPSPLAGEGAPQGRETGAPPDSAPPIDLNQPPNLAPQPGASATLVLGGARSGKSRYAEHCAAASGREVICIATAQAWDDEMHERIARHRADRPAGWRTVEEPLALAATLRDHAAPGRCLLIDCLTLWLSNLLCLENPQRMDAELTDLLQTLPALPGELWLVSNETGLGIVPSGALTRRYVDEMGRLHQQLAASCARVVFVTAGLPQALKGSLP